MHGLKLKIQKDWELVFITQTQHFLCVFLFHMFYFLVDVAFPVRHNERRQRLCQLWERRPGNGKEGSVLGKVSRVDKRPRDSWNGNGASESMRGVKTLRRSRGGAEWEFEPHDGISIICLIPLPILVTS